MYINIYIYIYVYYYMICIYIYLYIDIHTITYIVLAVVWLCLELPKPCLDLALPGQVHQPLAGGYQEAQPHGCARECSGIATVLCTWINILLVFVPLGIYSHMQEWSLGSNVS